MNDSRAADAAEQHRARALAEAWRSGTLVPGAPAPPPDDPVHVAPMGRGESFEAWEVRPLAGPSLTVRIPWQDPARHVPAMAAEVVALGRIPEGIGPRALALHEDAARSPIGAPCLVTSHMPGVALPPRQWTSAHLLAHARLLAALHRAEEPSRVPSWQLETSTLFAQWAAELPPQDPHRLGPVIAAAGTACAEAAELIDAAPRWTLCHGDLCATNIVWEGGRCAYIDFEWAMADDPARDLAIIGGSVHGGPWYVPMDEAQVGGFVEAYRAAGRELGSPVEKASALRARMRAWTLYERTAMLVHVAGRAGTSALHARALPQLRAGLAALLGLS